MPRLPRALTRTLAVLAALAGLTFAAAFVMILWNDPVFAAPPDLSPEKLAASEISFEQPYPSVKRTFRMGDGTVLHAQYLPAAGVRTTIVLLHGVLSSSLPLNRAAGLLRQATGAEVVALDLRGHGFSGGIPGDVEHIGQYEEDLGEVVRQIRAARPEGRVILAGHSMGGGIALRYAEKTEKRGLPPVDGYLLFAPYLGWAAPTTPKAAAPAQGEPFLRVHVPRILGLKLLNAFGIRAFDGLRIQFFNLPPELPLRSYSYRAAESMAPLDARQAVAAVTAPLLVVVGSRDEAFRAEAYEWVVRGNRRGRVEIVPGATHNGVLVDARAMASVREWHGMDERLEP